MTILRVAAKFCRLFDTRQKKGIVVLAIMMMVGGLLEMLSVSLVIPFINAIMSPEEVMNKGTIAVFCDAFGIENSHTFLIVSALFLAGMYILKNTFLVVQYDRQNRYIYRNQFIIQSRLLKQYLNMPYEFFLNVKSGEIIRVIGNDTSEVFGLLSALISFMTESIVSIALLSTIIIIAPYITIGMMIVLIVLIFVVLKMIRPTLRKAGNTCQKALTKMNQWMIQSIEGIKDIRIMNREKFFSDQFDESGRAVAISRYQNGTLSVIPRFLIEAVSMSSFFVFVALMIFRGYELDIIIPMVSAVAMAAIRLLPSSNRITQALANIAYREPMLDKLISVLENQEINLDYDEEKLFAIEFNSTIEMRDVTYHYPTSNSLVLKDANITILKGRSIGIIGKSGAGKTTAVDLLIGLLSPISGKICVDSVDISSNLSGWMKTIGYIPQQIYILDGSIRANVAFGIDQNKIDDNKVWSALKDAELENYVRLLPKGLDTEIGERGIRLSGGQRQRMGIARALFFDPSLLVFDEATSALDNDTENAIIDSITSLHGKKTMIIIAHRLSTIEHCDSVYKVDDGKITRVR